MNQEFDPGVPLCVDLDGTLIHTDMLHESVMVLLADNPLNVLRLPFWLLAGKAALKRKIASRVQMDPRSLPYNEPLIAWLRSERSAGRRLVLATASDERFAHSINEHLGLFDEVVASDGSINMAGRHKAAALEQRFGKGRFDYAGNATPDLTVWGSARRGVVVSASARVSKAAQQATTVEREFAAVKPNFHDWRRMLRVHQWLKNGLLFVPMLAAHQLSFALFAQVLLGVIAFSLCASSVYISNDLLDLESDRQHPRKRLRPFAAARIPIWVGCAATPLLLAASVAVGTLVGSHFLLWLGVYFAVTLAYSLGLKKLVLVDGFTLAALYTLRIVAGAAAVRHEVSFWLLAFSVFLFLSLAFVKRYAELDLMKERGREKAHGRGYEVADAPLVQTLGLASGYAAVVVLALYLNSDAMRALYQAPEWMWGAVPAVMFWISWVWLKTHRGEMHDDPVVFAIKDRTSLCVGGIFIASLVLGVVA
ncbi:UbiA family prenyltransferase [Uliginosibacterium sp. H3]|uniref:UbiA family prenyltransferase n=1 Tax=Uliginosibacterium silvisoli TaxID=3114758 RepID=A0ABU6K1R2_9RHOO|nr:UbiA family prenyltransferase [Uliginosibacterium sp. H3]